MAQCRCIYSHESHQTGLATGLDAEAHGNKELLIILRVFRPLSFSVSLAPSFSHFSLCGPRFFSVSLGSGRFACVAQTFLVASPEGAG